MSVVVLFFLPWIQQVYQELEHQMIILETQKHITLDHILYTLLIANTSVMTCCTLRFEKLSAILQYILMMSHRSTDLTGLKTLIHFLYQQI